MEVQFILKATKTCMYTCFKKRCTKYVVLFILQKEWIFTSLLLIQTEEVLKMKTTETEQVNIHLLIFFNEQIKILFNLTYVQAESKNDTCACIATQYCIATYTGFMYLFNKQEMNVSLISLNLHLKFKITSKEYYFKKPIVLLLAFSDWCIFFLQINRSALKFLQMDTDTRGLLGEFRIKAFREMHNRC